jgi:predicted metal-dependent hydrolase
MKQIQIREPVFDLEGGADPLWNPDRPELCHTLNAFQLALPYLEPYFIDAVKDAASQLTDPELRAQVVAFCAQEANHSRQHMRYCRVLRERYPRLRELERRTQQALVRSRRGDPLEWRLAYTAGYEAITTQMARWLFHNAGSWFRSADEPFGALMLWHAAEEIEHRHMAFDVLKAAAPGYGLRMRGLFAALRTASVEVVPVATYLLEIDGYAGRLDCRARRVLLSMQFLLEVALPAVIRYARPGFHPLQQPEPAAVARWRREHR